MTNLLLIVAVVVGISTGCDHDEPDKVPSNAEKTEAPATVAPSEPSEIEPLRDEPIAWVDGEPIPESLVTAELDRVRRHFERRRRPLDGSLLRARHEQALQNVIDRTLLKRRIAKAGIEVEADAVESAIAERIRGVFGSHDALARHLSERGWTLEQYHEHVRLELGTRALLGARTKPSSEDLHSLYRQVTNRSPTSQRARVTSVIFPGTTAVEGWPPAAKDRASFLEFAEDNGARVLIADRWIDQSTIDRGLADELFSVRAPGATRLVRTPGGAQAYWVAERNIAPTQHFLELESVLRERSLGQRAAEQRTSLLADLRRNAEIQLAPSAAQE